MARASGRPEIETNVETIVTQYLAEGDFVWVKRAEIHGRETYTFFDPPKLDAVAHRGQDNVWVQVWATLTGQRGGGLTQNWIPETLLNMLDAQVVIPPDIKLIPSKRQISSTTEEFDDFSGKGLILKLAQIQSPDFTEQELSLKFNRINQFLRTVTDRPDSRIEIPYSRSHVLVHMDNKVLPLSNLGTGIHEVIMIASFCTLTEDSIVCIEEPEIHLHPLLQRKLVRYLQAETSNQYFVATHSASFIDTPDSAIFHVTNDGTTTNIKESILRGQRYEICRDLGIRASDLIQSNAILWVEGPSDRLYVNWWLNTVSSDLIEGIHYSIMFYGGRLLSHLSALDEDVSEFINLRSLNQNLAILIDSDKAAEEEEINQTKRRIVLEFSSPALAWVTSGREVENYVPPDILQEAVKSAHPTIYSRSASTGRFDHALYFYREKAEGGRDVLHKEVDKMKTAKLICSRHPPDLSMLDLEARIHDLIEFIRRSN